jgi:hypothetical protein
VARSISPVPHQNPSRRGGALLDVVSSGPLHPDSAARAPSPARARVIFGERLDWLGSTGSVRLARFDWLGSAGRFALSAMSRISGRSGCWGGVRGGRFGAPGRGFRGRGFRGRGFRGRGFRGRGLARVVGGSLAVRAWWFWFVRVSLRACGCWGGGVGVALGFTSPIGAERVAREQPIGGRSASGARRVGASTGALHVGVCRVGPVGEKAFGIRELVLAGWLGVGGVLVLGGERCQDLVRGRAVALGSRRCDCGWQRASFVSRVCVLEA